MGALELEGGAVEGVELEFHGIVYNITVFVHEDELLVVKLEDKVTLDAWHGEFTSHYVEDITSKTGNFKKFSIFVRMLQSAVLQQSDSVSLDILTCQDLEMLKSKKAAAAVTHKDPASAQQQQQPARSLTGPHSTKRYLILTYASEFDRVHYPLPLLADEQPDPARLKAVIASLRQQLTAVQAGLPSPPQQHHQQQQHRGYQQMQMTGRARHQGDDLDAALLASRLEVALAELEGERAAHRREMRKKVRELQELQQELIGSRDVARELRQRIKTLETELESARSSSSHWSSVPAAGHGKSQRRPPVTDRYMYGNASYRTGTGKFPSKGAHQHDAPRSNSRGSSPAGSRTQSPSYARPWAQNSTPPRPPRPSSAPPKQRFDPTEYIRQKREREQQRVTARRSSSTSRGGSPAGSVRSRGGDRSGASTPRSTLSHASSFQSRSSDVGRPSRGGSSSRGVGALLGPNRPGSMQRHDDFSWQQDGSDLGRVSSAGRQQRPHSSGSAKDQLGVVYGVLANSRGSSRQHTDKILSRGASGRDGPGASSPGRALQGVRDKLDAYYAKQQKQQAVPRLHAGAVKTTRSSPAEERHGKPTAAAASGSPRQQAAAAPTAQSSVLQDATCEIADIDQRLHALQNFLKMAKSSIGAG